MLYRQKKDVLIRKTEHGAYILSKENYSEKIVNESGSVFLCALSKDPQSIETLADTILKSFVGADKETITEERIKYRIQMQQYKDIAKSFGLKEQKERIYIDGLGRV